MDYQRFDDQYVLRLDPDEDVMATLIGFADREDIRGGFFVAFGAFCRVRLRFFDYHQKQYLDRIVDEQVEVVSLLGNIARLDGQPMIHMHAAVSDAQLRTYSGHIGEGVVRPTLEVFLTRLSGEIRREKDPATGLELLALRPTRRRTAA